MLYPVKLQPQFNRQTKSTQHYTFFYKKIQEKIQKKLAKSKKICYYIFRSTFRGVAQLVERVVWDHEAAGSIPVTSTNLDRFSR